ncbi:MAG: type II toxin-antitoxin system RelE/ParE family toxin [Deltaproteobacteria bacterium]|nr:type II toxin-antitoxin system RelE/ParE family toxin [Deltaproteobacteria bacterium]
MSYRIELTKQAEKSFGYLMKSQPSIGLRIARAIDTIAADPSRGVPLKGKLKGLSKYRVGPYRIIYEIHRSHLLVIVIDIGHRKEIYK